MKEYDMHNHSLYSDGTEKPTEVVLQAKQAGLKGLAITDHDSVDGLKKAATAAKVVGLDFIPGIEITCRGNVHILGYGIDYAQKEKIDHFFQNSRIAREQDFQDVLSRYAQAGIMNVTKGEIVSAVECQGEPSTMHIARYRWKVMRASYEQIKREVLPGGICRSECLSELYPTAEEAIAFIKSLDGLAFLAHVAHTFLRNYKDERAGWWEIKQKILSLKRSGLDGIEAFHSAHSDDHQRQLVYLANITDCLISGGSDNHGDNKNYPFGNEGITQQYFLKSIKPLLNHC